MEAAEEKTRAAARKLAKAFNEAHPAQMVTEALETEWNSDPQIRALFEKEALANLLHDLAKAGETVAKEAPPAQVPVGNAGKSATVPAGPKK